MSDVVTKTIVGQCAGIIEKPSGWTEFEIQIPGKNYPTKLATKKSELIQAVRDLGGNVGTFTFNESDGNPNPHKPGEFYKNRYLEEVVAGAQAAPEGQQAIPTAGGSATRQDPSGTPVEAHHDSIHPADKDRAITRMNCLSNATIAYTGKAVTVFEDGSADDVGLAIMKLAGRFERWIYRDIDPVPSNPAARQPDPPPEPEPEQHPDDDIPF